MKILQINSFYKEGSTGKIVYDVQEHLRQKGYDMKAAFGRGRPMLADDDTAYRFCNDREVKIHNLFMVLGLSLQYGGSPLGTYRLINYIRREKPDVVHVHCINMSCVNIYAVLKFLAKKKIPTVVTHHGEFYYTGSCGHSFECNRWKENECRGCEKVRYATQSRTISRTHEAWKEMHKAFSGFDLDKLVFTAVSPWVKQRSMLSPIVNKFRCEVVKNGLDTKVFKNDPKPCIFDEKFGKLTGPVVLHSTASFWPDSYEDVKGGWCVVELAKRMPNVNFIIVSLVNITEMELPSNIYFWGKAKNQQELASLYSTADLTLLTSRKETFSMVCAESLCCGTPVIGFKAGGPETIALPDYSRFVENGDVAALKDVLQEELGKHREKVCVAEISKAVYDKSIMAENYLKIYKSFFIDIRLKHI